MWVQSPKCDYGLGVFISSSMVEGTKMAQPPPSRYDDTEMNKCLLICSAFFTKASFSLSLFLCLSLSFSLSLSLQNVFGYCHRISCRRRYPTDFCSIGTKTSVHWRKYFGQNVDTLNANISWFLPLGIYLRLLGQSKIQPCLGHGFFLLWLKDCLLEACMLMGEVRIQELR